MQRIRRGTAPSKTLHEEYGLFLEGMSGEQPWDLFFTATCPAGENRTAKAWRRDLKRSMDGGFSNWSYSVERGFWGLERHKSGQIHSHGLIRITENRFRPVSYHTLNYTQKKRLATDFWTTLWRRFGRSQVVVYESALGAAHYVSKYCTKDLAYSDLDWDIWLDPNIRRPLGVYSTPKHGKR